MRPQRRVVRRCLLQHGERRDQPLGVRLDFGAKRVDARAFEPLLRPRRQVASRRCLEGSQQVVQCAVSPGLVVEVAAQSGEERVTADPCDELLEDRRALGVSDAVEVGLDGFDVDDVGGDGMCRRQLVLTAGPGLFLVGKGRPGVWPARCFDRARGLPCRSRTIRSATGRPTSASSRGRRTTCAPSRAGSCPRGSRTPCRLPRDRKT